MKNLVKNEALRMLLAITALLLTALLTNPVATFSADEHTETVKMAEVKSGVSAHKKATRKVASTKPFRSTRSFAFFFKRRG